MWFLINKSSGEKSCNLLCNRAYTIGRTIANSNENPDLALSGTDTSISRKHAEILIKFNETQCTNLEARPSIILTDYSRFGTFVNEVRIKEFQSLNVNDVIRFGLTSFLLCNEPLMVTTSCVTAANKGQLKKQLCRLGGYLVNDWHNDCSFVVMDKLTITVKVINALISQKYIVTKNYFDDLVDRAACLSLKEANPAKYLPELAEENLDDVDFEPLPSRKVLFKGKKLVFFNNSQLQKMQNLIELAAGECELFNKSMTTKEALVNFLFINYEDENEHLKRLTPMLDNLNKRLVDETEIGLAILYCSMKKYCNPEKFDDSMQSDKSCYKLGSQTMTQSVFFEPSCPSAQYNDMVVAAFETQDSAVFQFEKDKINDTLKINDTPDKKKPKLMFDNPEFVDMKKSVVDKNELITSEIVIIENTDKDEYLKKKKINSPIDIVKDTKRNPSNIIIPSTATKSLIREPKEQSKYTDSKSNSLVFTKIKQLNNESSFQHIDTMKPSQIKIKFENLITKTFKNELKDDAQNMTNGKVNFKKFRKVPKASQSIINKENKLFKSFKNEPFDLNTQFDSFINSMR